MKKLLIITFAIILYGQFSFAQTALDVLENGIHLKDDEKIFILFENNKLLFDAAKSIEDPTNPVSFDEVLEDSTIFLINNGAIAVYIRPFNPLTFSSSTENKIIVDPVNESAATELGSIINILGTFTKQGTVSEGVAEPAFIKIGDTLYLAPPVEECNKFAPLQKQIELIQAKLLDDKKSKINDLFKQLKELSFIDEEVTKEKLANIKPNITEIETYFKDVSILIDTVKSDVQKYDCPDPEPFTTKFILNAIIKDLISTLAEQKKRLANLQMAYDLVEAAKEKAKTGGGVPGLRWCFKLDNIPSKVGKISVYTITIKESGLKLSDEGEIVSIEPKEILKRTLRVRKFQRFVPEASVGLAYTFLKYNIYGTTSDSTGQQFVGAPTETSLRNLNITTMINWNYYIPNSPIHPLYQIGVGINGGMPTILTGIGIRSNVGLKRLTISGGIAATWLQELNTLKVGDKVTGTDDINKDFKYSSSPTFTPYFGFQYNFK